MTKSIVLGAREVANMRAKTYGILSFASCWDEASVDFWSC
jgi:hypothetical protein